MSAVHICDEEYKSLGCEKIAVLARDVAVSYGKKRKICFKEDVPDNGTVQEDYRGKKGALMGLNLTAQEGFIYGLLGPSGCGKTTLLRCIVGLQIPNNGYIKVFGAEPGTPQSNVPGRGVGYMPQELALYPDLTIQETLNFFGLIYGMSKERIQERSTFLRDFLNLPEKSRLVQKLSSGEQRRVSLAVALIHSPPLLILDEPTVGVDPVLRKSVWSHLQQLTVEEHCTVVITTHYIEEVRQANVVGLMRGGRLLAESSPQALMMKYDASTLEEVFLTLCTGHISATEDTSEENSLPNFTLSMTERKQISNLRCCTAVTKYFMNVLAVFTKNFSRIRRNIGFLMFQFMVPALQQVLFCLFVGKDPIDLPLAIVNHEHPPVLSESYLSLINPNLVLQKRFSDVQTAFESIKSDETFGVMVFGENFTVELEKRYVLGVNASEATLNASTIRAYLDMSDMVIGRFLQMELVEAYETFTHELMGTFLIDPGVFKLPLSIEEPIYGKDSEYTSYIMPNMMTAIIFFVAVGLSAMTLMDEKKLGLIDRCWVAGVTPCEVLVSHAVIQILVLAVQVALVIIVTFVAFKFPSEGSIFWIIVLILLQGSCGIAYGLVIASFCTDNGVALMILIATFYPAMLFGGVFWPLQAVPHYLRYISYCLPLTLPSLAIRSVLSKGRGITSPSVWIGCLVSLGWLGALVFFAVVLFRKR